MKGTIPATVKSSDGSGETSDALATMVWPRSPKNSSQRWRMSAVLTPSDARPGVGLVEAGAVAVGGGLGELVRRPVHGREDPLARLGASGLVREHEAESDADEQPEHLSHALLLTVARAYRPRRPLRSGPHPAQ